MRLFLLLLLPLCFAVPAIDNIMDSNNDLAPSLENYFNSSVANNSTLEISFGPRDRNLTLFVSVDIAGMNLLIDNMTHATKDLSVITARGYEQDHIMAISSDGYLDFVCDREWYDGGAQYYWRCDLDEDYCAEYENNTYVLYNGEVNLTFRNVSEVVVFDSNVIAVPEPILEEMSTSSGEENLTVLIEGEAEFIYEINDMAFDGFGCYDNVSNFSGSVGFSVNESFLVAGDQKLFFLKAPILREQWFRNNRFDVVVLSQSPLYYAEIALDDNQTWNATIRDFYNDTADYGLAVLFSNKTNATGFTEAKNLSTPTALDRNNYSYAYTYEFGYKYQGLGWHNLSLGLNDSFLASAEHKEMLLSRMLTYGGLYTEEGNAVDDSTPVRKSTGFQKQEITIVEISLGFVALILFLAFLNFWIPTSS